MNIVICDDDELMSQKIEMICKQNLADKSYILSYSSPEKLLEELFEKKQEIDLFILDIEMPEMTGVQLRDKIQETYYGSNIIFLTSHEEIMAEAFGRFVIGFISKRNYETELPRRVKELEEEIRRNELIELVEEGKTFFVRKSRIIFVETQHIYTNVCVATGNQKNGVMEAEKYLVRKSLHKWKEELNTDAFYQIGKSCIVNFAYVKQFESDLPLCDGSIHKISRRQVDACKEAYFKYCKTRMG